MRTLTLTTNQIEPGLLVTHRAGPVFYPARLVLAVVGVWLLVLFYKLTVSTLLAGHLLARLVWVNLDHQFFIFWLGLDALLTGRWHCYGY